MAVRKLLGRSLTGSAWSTFLCLGQSLDTDGPSCMVMQAGGLSRHISSAVIRRRRKGEVRGGHHG